MTVDEGKESGPRPGEAENDIRETVRDLTAQVLRGGKVDPRGVEQVVRRMSAAAAGGEHTPEPRPVSAEERQALLDDLAALDRSLTAAAEAAHGALTRITTRGVDYSDNDLKEALSRMRDLQQAYVDTVNRIADAASGNVQRELRGLAGHAQRVGSDAGARVAGLMSEFANRLSDTSRNTATTGFDAAIDYGTRMSILASGVLAGIADGLRSHAGQPRDDEETR